jgi:hypothetical protein
MLQALGYIFLLTDGWTSPAGSAAVLTAECDAMHAVLMRRADALEGCAEGSPEEAELEMIVNAIKAYEAKRWPDGKEPGGKG